MHRSKDLFKIDLDKKRKSLNRNLGTKRKAVKIGLGKALTDNYITVKTGVSKNSGIFEIGIISPDISQ